MDHGPIKVTGNFVLKDMAGQVYDLSGRTKIALCRCAASNNKPFCDGSHKQSGFQSAVKAAKLPPPESK